jgi:hypothetical protein
MKAKICILCLACIAMGFILAGIPQARSMGDDKAPNAALVKWEYKIARGPDLTELNALGQEGWELVSVAAMGAPGHACFLKRPAGIRDVPEKARGSR